MKKILLLILLLSFSGNLFAMLEEENKKSYWPHVKIILGVGFTGLSIYFALKASGTTLTISDKIAEKIGHTFDNSASSFFSPILFISNGSAASWAPVVPAYFFLKSGFDDLTLEKKSLIEKELLLQKYAAKKYIKTKMQFHKQKKTKDLSPTQSNANQLINPFINENGKVINRLKDSSI